MGFHHGQDIGRPFQGTICFHEESVYGTALSGSTQSVSSVVRVARIESGDVNQSLRGINSIWVSEVTQKNVDYTFHLEYVPHKNDTLCNFLVDRTSEGTVRSLSFDIGANTDSATSSSYYFLRGCKCKNVEISGSQGEPWLISADFSVKSAGTSTATTLSIPPDPSTSLCMFNVAGSIKKTGSINNLAYVTNSCTITVNHNIEDLWSVGGRNKTAAIECAQDVTGTCDISLDYGGAVHFGDVIGAAEETTILVKLAAAGSGAPSFLLSNVRWDSSTIDVSDANEGMKESCPWTAEQITCGTA